MLPQNFFLKCFIFIVFLSVWITFLIVVFVGIHIAVAVMVWLSEYYSDAAIKSEIVDKSVFEMVEWVFKHVLSVGNYVNFQSPMSVMWLGIIKLGYGVGSFMIFSKL